MSAVLAALMVGSILVAAGLAIAGTASTGEQHHQQPQLAKTDKCPVCGMLVHRYPDFVASVTFRDKHAVFFDGAKDLFKFLFNLPTYAPGRAFEDIETIVVTEYYDMVPLIADQAFFVMGSDVLGPMGHELIPFRSADDARQFLQDHKGRRIMRFEAITPTVIKQLDR